MKKVLIVDDNDRYAINLEAYFKEKNIITDRAIDAKEGWEYFQKNSDYDMIVSDITMETQTSGLWLVRKIYKTKYKGILAIASTGFDVFGVMGFSAVILPWFCGLHWMIPKIPLKQGVVEWFPTKLIKDRTSPF